MQSSPSAQQTSLRFIRLTAWCAFTAVITTVLNTQLGRFYPAPQSFDETVRLVHNPVFMLRQWVLLLHPFVTLLLALGLYQVGKEASPGLALTGLLFSFLEKGIEVIGQTIQLFTVNSVWKPAYLASAGAAEKQQIQLQIQTVNAVWNDCYFVLWLAFILAALAFAYALQDLPKARWVRAGLWVSATLTFIMLLSDYGRQAWLEPILPFFYPPALIFTRLFIALFLWNHSVQNTPS